MADFSEVRAQQLACLLHRMAEMYPDIAGTLDAMRHTVVSQGEFSEDSVQGWVRLGEDIAVFVIDKNSRFYHADIGVLSISEKFVLYSDPAVDIVVGDNVFWQGEPYLVEERIKTAGVIRLKINNVKSTFRNPLRGGETYRQFGARAAIS